MKTDTASTHTASAWWKEAVVYQIYPLSFMDSNGDGIGDIPGITSRLDYLKDLGVDVIWLSPIFESPGDDNGYDISDYRAINPQFGTLSDFKILLEEIHKRGLKLVIDGVYNHSSDEHKWFVEAKKSKDNKYRDYYYWRKGVKGEPPNNWKSIFSGPAWEYDEASNEYYLHLFTKKQPDLNWENKALRQEIYDIMNYWLDMGVDGFRLDVINAIKKAEGLPDESEDFCPYMNQPGINEFFQEMHREVFEGKDIMTVGETAGVTPEIAALYTGEDRKELNMIFQFEHVDIGSGEKWSKPKPAPKVLKGILSRWQEGLCGKGWNSLYFSNHDQPRQVSRFGDDKEFPVESAKALATINHTLQGTPYIYQGEELGMTNAYFERLEQYRDVEVFNYVKYSTKSFEELLPYIWAVGRDNSRTPFQWDDSKNAGFTTGEPWIEVNKNYPHLNAQQQQNDPSSVLAYYKKLLKLRKEHKIIVYGHSFTEYLKESESLYVYTREYENQTLLTVVNLSGKAVEEEFPQQIEELFAKGRVLTSNYEDSGLKVIRPYEAFVCLI